MPFDAPSTSGTTRSPELERWVADQRGRPADEVADAAVGWAVDRLADGVHPAELCDAAVGLALDHRDLDALAAADAHRRVALLTQDAPSGTASTTAPLAAVQLLAHAAGVAAAHVEGDARPAASRTPDPGEVGIDALDTDTDADDFDAVDRFLDAALRGELVEGDPRWFAAVRADADHAEEALLAAGAAGYRLDERHLVLPAQLRRWLGGGPCDPVLFDPAVALVGGGTTDPAAADEQRTLAEELALDALDRAPEDFGRLPRGGHERVTTVATGLARTPDATRAALLAASLQDGLCPDDLVEAVALLAASGVATTSFEGDAHLLGLAACTGADAVQLCLAAAQSPGLRYELALCSILAPGAASLDPVGELWVPPTDDGGLDDLRAGLDEGDPDAAAEAATAVHVLDPDTADAAWQAVRAAAATDQWSGLATLAHVVAMERCFRSTEHPARGWYLAAAARAAGHATAREQPLAERALGSLGD